MRRPSKTWLKSKNPASDAVRRERPYAGIGEHNLLDARGGGVALIRGHDVAGQGAAQRP
jgi:hypothetical protein